MPHRIFCRPTPLFFALMMGTTLAGCGGGQTSDAQRVRQALFPAHQPIGQTAAPAAASSGARLTSIPAGASDQPVRGFVRPGLSPPNLPAVIPDEAFGTGRPVSLNLINASIDDLAAKVLGDVVGASYVIEADLPGIATLSTGKPLAPRRIVGLFEDILAARGAALLWSGGVFRIVPAGADALRGAPVATSSLAGGIGYTTRVARLRHIQPSALAEILEPIAPQGAVRSLDDARNLIVLGGSQGELAELERTIQLFDVDWLAGQSIALVPLQRADPVEVAEELSFMLATENPEGAKAARILPVSRARAVLVVAPSNRLLNTITDVARFLDVSGQGDGRAVHVYKVQNRNAVELAGLVTQIFASTTATPVPADPEAPQPVSFSPSGATATNGVSVVADDTGNALIIRAPQDVFDQAIAVVERLDAVPNQVLLDVTIAEVTLADDLEYGVEWFLEFGDFSGQFTPGALTPLAATPPGLSLLLSGTNASVVLNALASVTDIDVVSSPSLMVLDNREAILQIGDQVPIVTQSAVSVGDPEAPIVNAVSYRDTGVTLTVRPRVSDNGLVLLDIDQDVSDVVETTTSGIDSPTIRQRRIATTVAVTDGESLVLGGLIRNANTDTVDGVPLLKDIPVAGELFKNTVESRQRTELLVVITPRVVRDRSKARQVTAELAARLISVRPAALGQP
ncbi:MAG: type II secretion system secretin GspD [Pseudomonadota bacterium]